MIKQCPVCKKEFEVLYPDQWGYIRNGTYYCTWKCLRRKENEQVNTLTKEQKEKTIEIALEGGDYLQHLQDCGLKNPSSTWFYIKKKLEKDDPEKFEEIERAMHRKANKKWKAKQGTEQLQLDAGKNYTVKVDEAQEKPENLADAMTGMKDTADDFFGECKKMGLKVGDLLKVQSVMTYEVTAIDTEYGEFYRDKKFNCIDWRNAAGDELSMGLDRWKKLAEELPTILEALGVEM